MIMRASIAVLAVVALVASSWQAARDVLLPVAIVRPLSHPGAASVGQATAMSVVLMAVTAAITVAIDRFRVGAFGRI